MVGENKGEKRHNGYAINDNYCRKICLPFSFMSLLWDSPAYSQRQPSAYIETKCKPTVRPLLACNASGL